MPFDLSKATPPVAEKRPVEDTRHGITRTDDYAWLKADNWQDVMRDPSVLSQDIRGWLEGENAYFEAMMDDTKKLQDALFEELKGRIKQDDSSVPTKDGPYAYQSRYEEGKEYPLFVRMPRDGGEETVLFDGPKEASGKDYFALGHMEHSTNHNKLAWSVDENGSEYYHMRLRGLADGKDSDDLIRDVGSFAWAADSERYLYVKVDDKMRPSKVFGCAPGEEPKLIYAEEDPRFYVGLDVSLDGKTIEIATGQNDEDEVRLVPADDPFAEPVLVSPRRPGHEYSVIPAGDTLYIVTNSGGAENFRIMTAPLNAPQEKHWKELIPHRAAVKLASVIVFKNHMVRLEVENALPRIVVRELASGDEHTIDFDEEAYSLGISSGYEFDTTTLRFTYSSPSTPGQVWDYDLISRERTLRKTQEIPSGHDPKNYVVRRLHAPAKDGELVPLTVLHHKDTPIDGTAPCLLYGYGSYGAGMSAGFSSHRLSLVNRGFVYCTAHIRGGDEKGRHWYEQTKKAGKMKTFTDFISSGRYLIDQGFTAEGRIVANGRSAGGLLMGAVANLAPELFAGIMAEVPFVDVLNTMLDDSLPLTPGEWSQWGNPIESEEEYKIIAAYSPYDNVREQAYPAMYVSSGLTDPRVQYWEPSKWVAKLRDVTKGETPIILKTNMGSGHFGKTGRFAYLEEVAQVYAFALKAVGKA
ncbi:S9 family peptidase [Pseudahrensia aquimaris]|uniref:S9 family peptidase n=1 Tax=Pseudahrensia aquimaris TaxID=744461 RepID=A0ABW3FGJ3_9HYPH